MSDELLLERDGTTAILTLNRPDVANAVNEPMTARWEEHLDALESDESVRAVVLTGAGGRVFCAGGDLKWFAAIPEPEAGAAMSARMTSVLERMWRLEVPVVAAVNGGAYGGGCEILTACHVRLAADTARFGFRQAAMGVVTGWGGGARLFDLVGAHRALRLLVTAESVSAAEARDLGLVDALLPAAGLRAAALRTAGHIAGCARESVAAFLELARLHVAAGRDAAARLESDRFADLWGGPEFLARIAAARGR